MYLIECANAYLAAVQLQQKEMDYQTAFAVMMVKNDFTVQHAPVPEKITPMQLEALEKFIVFGGEG